ncbi:hypothetical protein CBR_g24236 [Chara braunii]|uniref:Uncharacterized protein n=1 Tax=Chara braunii TaxID=69332 RepID=A0A388JM48_CHABU|nr:hypothetical protein CBR_g24236 [Chara braunii]|eukprot:GBG58884.1 hypothetical protein CBR_g24236 [Chara braunii]
MEMASVAAEGETRGGKKVVVGNKENGGALGELEKEEEEEEKENAHFQTEGLKTKMAGKKAGIKGAAASDYANFDLDLGGVDVETEVLNHGSSTHLFLDRFSEYQVLGMLEETGCLERLRSRGFHDDLRLAFDLKDAFVHKMFLYSATVNKPLCQLFVRVMSDSDMTRFNALQDCEEVIDGVECIREWLASLRSGLSIFMVEWLLLQNPLAPVVQPRGRGIGDMEKDNKEKEKEKEKRSLLPGQQLPGLGLGRRFGDFLATLAQRSDCDAMVNRPLFFHNALMYARDGTTFLNPEVEGKFQRLLRDLRRNLRRKGLAAVSRAVHCGALRHAHLGFTVSWHEDEQIRAFSDKVRGFLEGESYKRLVARHVAAEEEERPSDVRSSEIITRSESESRLQGSNGITMTTVNPTTRGGPRSSIEFHVDGNGISNTIPGATGVTNGNFLGQGNLLTSTEFQTEPPPPSFSSLAHNNDKNNNQQPLQAPLQQQLYRHNQSSFRHRLHHHHHHHHHDHHRHHHQQQPNHHHHLHRNRLYHHHYRNRGNKKVGALHTTTDNGRGNGPMGVVDGSDPQGRMVCTSSTSEEEEKEAEEQGKCTFQLDWKLKTTDLRTIAERLKSAVPLRRVSTLARNNRGLV